jgi:Fe-S-cluster-containing dehydrogenase component
VSYRKYSTFDLPRGLTQYLTESCRHCSDAPCIDACPVGAITRDEKGWTHVDRDQCVGCRACFHACHYGSPVFDGEGKSLRCDGCLACVRICPNGALRLES